MFAEKVDEIQMMYRSMESFESDNNDREVKMKISTKGRYAIKLMLDLATYYNGEPVKIKDIARRQHISDKYLEQIMIKHLDLPKQGHLSPPVLRWCASSILVPLQDSTTLARQEKK